MDALLKLLKDLTVSQVEGDRNLLNLVNQVIDKVIQLEAKQIELESVVSGLLKTASIHSELIQVLIDAKKESIH